MRFNKLQNSSISSAQPLEARTLLANAIGSIPHKFVHFKFDLDLNEVMDNPTFSPKKLLNADYLRYTITVDKKAIPEGSHSNAKSIAENASRVVKDTIRGLDGKFHTDPYQVKTLEDPVEKGWANLYARNKGLITGAVHQALAQYSDLGVKFTDNTWYSKD